MQYIKIQYLRMNIALFSVVFFSLRFSGEIDTSFLNTAFDLVVIVTLFSCKLTLNAAALLSTQCSV